MMYMMMMMMMTMIEVKIKINLMMMTFNHCGDYELIDQMVDDGLDFFSVFLIVQIFDAQ